MADAASSITSDDPKSPLLPLQIPPPNPSRSPLLTINTLCIISGPLLCLLIYFLVDLGGRHTSRNMLAVLAWIFAWWLTKAVPMAVTSMSPLFLFPMFGIATADEVAKAYMDDIIALVLGSFILALAVEHYNIHRRLALNITTMFCGDPVSPRRLLLAICGTTFFVSMWMHNTPTAMLMVPVATGILHRFPETETAVHPDVRRFCKAVVLGVIYSTSIGGMSTLIGSGVTIILVGMWENYFPMTEPISFSTWFFFGFPFAMIMFFAMWALLCVMYCSKGSQKTLAAYLDRAELKRDLELLGPMAFAEKMVLIVFGLLVLLWMTRSISDDLPGWGVLFHGQVGDGSVSVMMATLLFIIPNGQNKGEKLMDWEKCKKLHWNVILLLGAGFAIANGVQTSGLSDMISSGLTFLKTAPYLAIAPVVFLVSSTVTEFTSNDATATLVLPILVELAESLKVHPLLLMVPGAIGAQFSFLLPTSTPSNVVGFTTGHFEIMDMIMTGLPLKIIGIVVLSLLMPTLGSWIFEGNNQSTMAIPGIILAS